MSHLPKSAFFNWRNFASWQQKQKGPVTCAQDSLGKRFPPNSPHFKEKRIQIAISRLQVLATASK
jgi:hypothetical protein